MSYQFCLGASGAGKSTQLHRWVIRQAQEALGRLDFSRNFMIVVPDQYTMQTQKELVFAAGDAGGIMNVDVLSFGRLSHRIFEEVGEDRRPVLDDMGKNLVLRRLVTTCRKDLKVLDRQIDRLGMITEVKSAISEFMQYGIGVEDVGNLAAYAAAHGQGGLALRLQDLQTLYAAFLRAGRGENTELAAAGQGENAGLAAAGQGENAGLAAAGQGENAGLAAAGWGENKECAAALSENFGGVSFITGEETLDVLAEKIPESRLVKESVIIFDGFTGFTPVQYRVLRALMQNAEKVVFALDYGEDGGTPLAGVLNGAPFEAQDLFYLTRKTVNDIARMAARDGVPREADWIVGKEIKSGLPKTDWIGGAGKEAFSRGTDWIVGETQKGADDADGGGRKAAECPAVPARFRGNPSLAHLERSLFRYPVRPYFESFEANPDRTAAAGNPDDGMASGKSADRPALSVHLAVCSNPEQEVRQMCIRIRKLMQEKGYQYRDFGVVTGDLAGYEDAVRLYAGRYGIPVYVDTNRAVLQNPLTETIRAALEISAGDYRYETVFRFLRSGLSGLSADEIDRLENYCLARGIRSRKRWETAFDEEFEGMREHFLDIIRPLQDIASKENGVFSEKNDAGRVIASEINDTEGNAPFGKNDAEEEASSEKNPVEEKIPAKKPAKHGKVSAAARARALYEFLIGIHAGEQMQLLSEEYEAAGDTAHAMEYGQVYGAVIHLLDELYELLGEETVSAEEFKELAEAGFEEIRLGVLPQQVDRVLVGDIERTRMPEVRVLFFLGVNDGNIPKATSKGGLISDLDREFLQESDVLRDSGGELAPTPRQQMYIQRLYLYMNMTKPSDALYVSYVRTAGDGSSVRPSYLIGVLHQIFPSLEETIPEEDPLSAQMVCPQDAASFLAEGLRDYADGMYLHAAEHPELHLSERLLEFETVYGYCAQAEDEVWHAGDTGGQRAGNNDYGMESGNMAGAQKTPKAGEGFVPAEKIRTLREVTGRLRDAAFLRYQPVPISKKTAQKLYGHVIRGSVTRLEAAAQCYLRQYLQYGLRLAERKEYTFEANDSGTILHESVQRFGQLLKENGIGWTSYSAEQGHALVRRALEESAGEYNDQVLYATERTAYQTNRLLRTLERTVDTLQFQLQQGDFLPAALEEPFGEQGELQFHLEDGGRLQLIGRIDRVDLAVEEADGKIYLKILDYKSGSRDLDPKMMRAGIQLQLLLYLCAEEQRLRRRWPGAEIIPSAMLYYHFDDPMLGLKDADRIFTEEILNGEDAAAALELQTIRQKLRPKGMVGSEEDILGHLDHEFGRTHAPGAAGGSSLVIPVKRLRNGSLGAGSRVFSQEEFRQMEKDLKAKVCELANHILEGDIQADPAVLRPNITACTYCPYRNVCGFDLRIPGYEYREIR